MRGGCHLLDLSSWHGITQLPLIFKWPMFRKLLVYQKFTSGTHSTPSQFIPAALRSPEISQMDHCRSCGVPPSLPHNPSHYSNHTPVRSFSECP